MVLENGEEERTNGKRCKREGRGKAWQVEVQITGKGIFLGQWSACADLGFLIRILQW